MQEEHPHSVKKGGHNGRGNKKREESRQQKIHQLNNLRCCKRHWKMQPSKEKKKNSFNKKRKNKRSRQVQSLQYRPLCQTAPAHGASSGYTKLAEMADTLTDQKQTSTHPCNNDKRKKKSVKSTSTKTSLEALTNKQTGEEKKKKFSHLAQPSSKGRPKSPRKRKNLALDAKNHT